MPVQPDPTHPKFLEGDDVARPATAHDDDVEGHFKAMVTSDDESTSEPEGIRTRNTDDGDDDVDGHLMR
jgi:hypothetical protein